MCARVLLLFRPTCGPDLGLCRVRKLPTSLHTHRLSGIEIDTHSLDANLLLLIERLERQLPVDGASRIEKARCHVCKMASNPRYMLELTISLLGISAINLQGLASKGKVRLHHFRACGDGQKIKMWHSMPIPPGLTTARCSGGRTFCTKCRESGSRRTRCRR